MAVHSPPVLFDLTIHDNGASSLIVDGVDVSHLVREIRLTYSAQDRTPTIALDMACWNVRAHGEAQVTHVCGVADVD